MNDKCFQDPERSASIEKKPFLYSTDPTLHAASRPGTAKPVTIPRNAPFI